LTHIPCGDHKRGVYRREVPSTQYSVRSAGYSKSLATSLSTSFVTRFAMLRRSVAKPRRVPAKEDLVAQKFTFDDLKNILVNRIGLPDKLVVDDPNTTFESMGLDSLAFVEIQLAVQQQYGFAIPDEDAQKIHTVGEAISYTNSR